MHATACIIIVINIYIFGVCGNTIVINNNKAAYAHQSNGIKQNSVLSDGNVGFPL